MVEATKKTKVLIVDDHDIVRQGLRRVLEMDPHIQIVGEARNGVEAVSRAIASSPDVVVMDLKMPDMDGITATREIKQRLANTNVLILTMFADDYVEEAIEAGVSGYLLKDGDSQKIANAIQQMREGVNPIAPALNKRLITEYYKLRQKSLLSLTKRQVDILRLMCDGVDSDGICAKLDISLSTEKRELRNIFNVLGVNSRAHAIAVAIKQGLLEPARE